MQAMTSPVVEGTPNEADAVYLRRAIAPSHGTTTGVT